jgi:hypothetical protein
MERKNVCDMPRETEKHYLRLFPHDEKTVCLIKSKSNIVCSKSNLFTGLVKARYLAPLFFEYFF